MRLRGFAAVVAVAGMLITGVAAPASAAAGPTVLDVGFTPGQSLPAWKDAHPVVSDDAVKVGYFVNDQAAGTIHTWPASRVRVAFPIEFFDTEVDLTLRAWDADGNVGEATVRVRVDTQRPTLTYTPPSGSVVHGRTTITFTDPVDDLAEVVMLSSAGTELAKVTAAPWAIEWDFTGQNGRVRFIATDRAGNTSKIHYFGDYRVDDQGPEITLFRAFHQPGTALLQARVADASPLERIEWWIEGALRSTQTSLYYDFGTAERQVPVEVRAWDQWGNQSVTTIPVRLDRTPPAVAKVTPNYRQLIRGTYVTSTITATDPSGFMYVDLDGEVFGANADGPTGTFTGTKRLGRDGYLTVNWQVSDRAGNLTRFPRTFIVDNTRPKITKVTAPAANAKVGTQVKTSMTATDLNGIREVQMWVNGKLTVSDPSAPYHLTLNTAGYGKSFTVAFHAVDKAGNAISTSARTWKR